MTIIGLADQHAAHKERLARIHAAGKFPLEQSRVIKVIPRYIPDEPEEESPPPPPEVQPDFYDRAWAMLGENPAAVGRMANVVNTVLAYFHDIPRNEFMSIRRKAHLVRPRHIAMYLCKTRTSASFPEIGRFLGGRDHTTVLHGVNKVTAELSSDPELAHDVAWIERFLDGEAP